MPSERRIFLGVSLLSLCGLMLQLALTRLFSATMHYHFAFLAISLVLFGAGAAGVFVYAFDAPLRRAPTAGLLAVAALLSALATLVALLVVLGSPVSPEDTGWRTFARLAWIYGAASLPFFFAGCAVTLAIARYAPSISRLYLFDLGGAAAGCLLLIPVLNAAGAPNTVLLVAALAAGAGVLFAGTAERQRPLRFAALLLALLLAGLAFENAGSRRLDVRWAKGLAEDESVLFSRWNSFSRVTVRGSLAEDRLLIQIDADAAATLNRRGDQLERHRELAGLVEGLAYHLRPGARALIIGPGGGNDVIVARLLGARQITAVEVNPIIARDVMSAEPFLSYSGALYQQPGVSLVVDEGRSFLRRSQERYDVVQATMVDTWAATAAGAFALTENNLYTVEAFREYLERLQPDGLLSMTRCTRIPRTSCFAWCHSRARRWPKRGWENPGRGWPWCGGRSSAASSAPATFLLKREPFSDGELARLEELAARYRFELLYTPRTRADNLFKELIEADPPHAFLARYPNDVAPTRDDNPFFFHTLRLRNLGAVLSGFSEWHKTNLGTFVLVALLVASASLTLLLIFGPLLLLRGRLREVAPGTKLAWLLYFACLGAGFILVEVALVQKCILFLGHPVYSLTVVLFSLLVFSGLGSALSGRVGQQRLPQALPRMLAVLAALIAASVAALSPAFYALVQLERPLRIALCVALLAPVGLAMGMPMPSAIRILAERAPGLIPWGWGVNGAASVLGSVAALVLAILVGFDRTLLLGAGLYLVALALGRSALRRPGPGSTLAAQRETAAIAERYLASTTSQR